jgi:hypothetical protein
MKNQLSFYILQLTTSLYTWGIKENLKEKQTDKDGKLVLYAGNKDAQHSYIEIAQEKDMKCCY